MLSHFTLKTQRTALAPIKGLFFTGVAIIKPDLPIIFLSSLPLPSPCRGPSQGGRDKDGPGMGNGASKLNITPVSLETHPLPTSQISFCLLFLDLSHLFLSFLYSSFNDSALHGHVFSRFYRSFIGGVLGLTLCAHFLSPIFLQFSFFQLLGYFAGSV